MLLSRNRGYRAFTLIEMLIVIAIIIILGTLSLAAYQRMQVVMRTNEYINSLEQDIRKIQRDAMLLDRKQGEGWPFGIGIDFRDMGKETSLGSYKVFKWCSGEAEYGGRRTTSSVPGYAKNESGTQNLPASMKWREGDSCASFGETLLRLPIRYLDLKPPKSTITVHNTVVTNREGGTPRPTELGFVLFESVTGKAFFYDTSGKLINYQARSGNMELVGNPAHLIITVKPLRGGVGKNLTIENISGRMEIKANE